MGRFTSILFALILLASPAVAQSNQPVRLVVPFSAGGAYDVIARIMTQYASPLLGRPIVVENRPGAGGSVGAGMVAKSAPDGNTLLLSGQSSAVLAPYVIKNLSYDPNTELVPVTYVCDTPMVLMLNKNFPANNFAEFVDLVRKNPGKYTYASFGVGSTSHLLMELLNYTVKLDMVHVPYGGAAPALIDVISGQPPVTFSSVASAKAFLSDGRLKAFAAAATERSPEIPDVPTFKDLGVDAMTVPFWVGVMAPKGTPTDVIAALDKAFRGAVSNPEVQVRFLSLGLTIKNRDTAAFTKMLDEDRKRWAKVIAIANITPK